MKVLIAPDKFKGTLTGKEAADCIARGWRQARPADQLHTLPVCDGGDAGVGRSAVLVLAGWSCSGAWLVCRSGAVLVLHTHSPPE